MASQCWAGSNQRGRVRPKGLFVDCQGSVSTSAELFHVTFVQQMLQTKVPTAFVLRRAVAAPHAGYAVC